MPEHDQVRAFAEAIGSCTDYQIRDENPLSRVVCLERLS
jgi:tRNA wybutosine-synthesizing protein 1